MKAFLIQFFGLSSCFKVDAVESNQRDDDYQRNRRRRRMEDDETSYASRSLVHIDENSTLRRTNYSSRRRTGDGSLSSDSISSTQQRRPSKSGSNSSRSRMRNKNVPRKPSFSTDRYEGRDDPQALGLSLSETMGHSYEERDEYREVLDEQSAIRRSLKDQSQSSIRRKKYSTRRASSPRSNNSQRTNLESFIDGHEKTSPLNDDDSIDNVTTISKASINPYRLLNVSQSATPRDVYHGYKQKLKETEMDGGGDKAFHDVGNAYRRIRAEIERQERRRTEQSRRKLTSKSNGNRDGSRRKSQKRRNSTRRQQRQFSTSSSSDFDDDEDSISSRATAIGARLKDHRELVNGLFANDNKALGQKSSSNGLATRNGNGEVTSLQNAVYNQSRMLSEMNIVPIDAGATNVNEKNETITNSCFYLSLAASYLSGVGAFSVDPTVIYSKRSLVNDDSNQTIEMDIATLPKREKQMTKKLALQLKRAIEAAVMLVHPDWASSGMVGEEVQAFSDFLVYALDSDSVLGHWSIAVFDEASGFVDVYRGRHYGKFYPPTKVKTRHGREKLRYKDCDVETKRENTLTLRYIPGHYQPLLPELTKMGNERRKRKVREAGKTYQRATLEEILRLLKQWKVLHVVTDGRA